MLPKESLASEKQSAFKEAHDALNQMRLKALLQTETAVDLKTYQKQFATAIRFNDAKHMPYAVDEKRLAVYCRLVRNNTLGFIDRCYVEAPKHLSEQQWADLKERFIREGQAHSPFFQDIAGEFLQFCQEKQAVSPEILALMDFENAQLLAEVALPNVQSALHGDDDTVMQFSGCAELRQYDYDFLSSNFQEILPEESKVLIWRDREFLVYYRLLEDWDFLLLTVLQEQPQSFNQLCGELSALIKSQPELLPLLKQLWQKWTKAEVIYPYESQSD